MVDDMVRVRALVKGFADEDGLILVESPDVDNSEKDSEIDSDMVRADNPGCSCTRQEVGGSCSCLRRRGCTPQGCILNRLRRTW